ncbi:cell wall hydrolase [Croceicoccus naphthovorans]|uniref:Uncharacterized protein n=1 Tax=Croceicoccus naphthovorans TaxID=1348774 RepID=A0A0G3XI31_9SPHN|nr:cell wall hydrolase [Croceicoccus naphthovorans]AKM11215.1 hypothetical protein AB433_16530 [Croceicoccus naphthovorans]MBB3989886.1 hypothetical protein [Croceicoccus naphthovorans]
MSRKVRSASALSLVATLGVILLGTDGSSAFAQAGQVATVASPAPSQIVAETTVAAVEVPVAPQTKFISQAVVQPVPETPEPVISPMDSQAASLAELVAEQPVPGKLDEQLQCLAGAIYFESKGEPLDGQLAVGRVIVARAESGRFPSSYCGVVYQRSQFSFVRGGRMPAINKASRAWQRAKKIAMIAHDGMWDSPAEGALFFHARYVSPRWKNSMTRLARIDNHIFYR